MKLAYIVTNVGNGNKFLSDSMEFVPLALSQHHTDNMDGTAYSASDLITMPTEVFVVGLGSYNRRPILFIRTKVDLLIYQVKIFATKFRKIQMKFNGNFSSGLSIHTWSLENSVPKNEPWHNDSNIGQSSKNGN